MHHQALQRQLAQQGCHTQQPQKSEQRHNKTTYSVNSGSTLTFGFQYSGNWHKCHPWSSNHIINHISMYLKFNFKLKFNSTFNFLFKIVSIQGIGRNVIYIHVTYIKFIYPCHIYKIHLTLSIFSELECRAQHFYWIWYVFTITHSLAIQLQYN